MKKTKKANTRQIAVIGMLFALLIIFAFVPINIMGIQIAVLPLIVIFIGCQTEGFKVGFFLGLGYGLCSLISAFTQGANILAPIFYNPMVSVVPRMLIGVTCYFSYVGLKKGFQRCFKNKESRAAVRWNIVLSSAISSAVGVITNTLLVVGMIYAFNAGENYGGTVIDANFLSVLIGINFLIEIVIAVILTPPIVLTLCIAMRKTELKPAESASDEGETATDTDTGDKELKEKDAEKDVEKDAADKCDGETACPSDTLSDENLSLPPSDKERDKVE